jgi:hypothetical protein
MAINWLELAVWGQWYCNYETDVVVSVSAVSELNSLSGSHCTWHSAAAAKEQNNIRWKNLIETQAAS